MSADARAGDRRVGEHLALALALTVLAVVVWFGLGMQRGLLLSSDVKSRVWPWAPTLHAEELQAEQLTDPVWQFVPWLQFARRELLAGHLPLWNPHQDGGVPLLGNGQSALLSPLSWPVLIAGVKHGWNLSLLLRILVMAAGVWVWLRRLGRTRTASLLGAVMTALSGPFIAWLEHPHTLALAGAPWLLAGLEGLVAGRGRRSWGLAVAGAWLVLVGGHPETVLMVALLAAAWMAARCRALRCVVSASGAALCGALLAAPVLVPLVEYLLLSEARSGVGRQGFVLPWSALAGMVSPSATRPLGVEAAITVSLVGLGLAVLGAALARRDPALLFWAGATVVVVLLAFSNPLSRWVAATTDLYWSRCLLLMPLTLAPLSTAALDWVSRRLQRPALRLGLPLAAVVVAALELTVAARGVHAVTPASWVDASTPLMQRLAADPAIFRILPLHTFLPPNAATAVGLDDVRGYDALAPAGWRRGRDSFGRFSATSTVTDVLEPWDLVRGGAALDFWNVKYLLLHPQLPYPASRLNRELGLDVVEVYNGPDGRILENKGVLPRARFEDGTPVEVVLCSPTRWELAVDADMAGRLTVANPYFPGWQARLDGKSVKLGAAPGEAIEIEVPPGRHTVVLRYRPGSLLLGLVLAGLGVVIVAASLGGWSLLVGYWRQRR